MHILLAPDKFKGSLSAAAVCRALALGIHAVAPEVTVTSVPVADGGDGTLDAAVAAGFERVAITVDGPTGHRVNTTFAQRNSRAVVELACTCGLDLLPDGQLDALGASSFGLGQAIASVLDAGCRELVVGIGGSASTDGGAGMMQALGARLVDSSGAELARGGAALADLARLDLSGLHPGLAQAELVFGCDVRNPLLGPAGAAAVYGPQKGAVGGDVDRLDAALATWARVVAAATSTDLASAAGAGAAGGVGFAALALLGVTLAPGIDLILELGGFLDALSGADLVVTGEGSLDEQTLQGKAPAGVAAAAVSRGIPVVAVAGRVLLAPQRLAQAGLVKAYALADLEPDRDRSMSEAASLLEQVGRSLAQEFVTRRSIS